jgi:hypothetical protein
MIFLKRTHLFCRVFCKLRKLYFRITCISKTQFNFITIFIAINLLIFLLIRKIVRFLNAASSMMAMCFFVMFIGNDM